jgi:gas vesicle protein GvpL/GvpF
VAGGLYLYAVLADRPRRLPRSGLRGERLRLVGVGRLLVVVGDLEEAPPPVPRALRGHDVTVRRLAAGATAVLPVRFGTLVADAAELARQLRPRARELRAALRLVAGREQMTLRVYGQAGPLPRRRPAGGPGARYLTRRARAAALPEIDPLRSALAGLVQAERVERRGEPPLLARVDHLIDRGRGRAYRAAVRATARRLAGLRVRVTGPWAPYAFAAEAVP